MIHDNHLGAMRLPCCRVGYENAVTLAPYDYRHRERRKLIYEAFSSRKVSRYHEFGERRARKLMVDLLHDPGNFQRHITGSESFVPSND